MPPFLRRLTAALRRRRALWAAWRRLSPSERRHFMVFAAGIPAVALSLRALGFRRTQRALTRLTGGLLPGGRARTLAAEQALLLALAGRPSARRAAR
jgi:hypothetical protein